MKQPLSVRIDSDLLAAARNCARQGNRTLTNFIETALIVAHRGDDYRIVPGSRSPRLRARTARKCTVAI